MSMDTNKSRHPDWALQYKKSGTELRRIRGKYYLYEVSSYYDREKKKSRKKTGRMLGRITEKEGFTASKHNTSGTAPGITPSVGSLFCRESGLSCYLMNASEQITSALKEVFPGHWQIILGLVYCRLGWQAPLKNVPCLLEGSALKRGLALGGTNEKSVRATLAFCGGSKDLPKEYMRRFVRPGAHNLIDATEFFSKSRNIPLAAKGYNKDMVFERQISLLYIYSASDMMPVYYRLLAGNLREVKTMALTVKESMIGDAVLIADKGFYSKANIAELKGQGLDFLIPLKRSNKNIDYGLLAYIESSRDYFKYKGRYIYCAPFGIEGDRCILFWDGRLKEEEKTDYLDRIVTHPETFSQEKLPGRLPRFGTLALLTSLEDTSPENLYLAYKSRSNIEQMFDSLKNVLGADASYMQEESMLEGWMFINHIALQYHHILYRKLKENSLLRTYSVEDILMFLKNIRQVNIAGKWHNTEVVSKITKVLTKIGIPITCEF